MPRVGKYWLSMDLNYWLHELAHTWAKVESEDTVDENSLITVPNFDQGEINEATRI